MKYFGLVLLYVMTITLLSFGTNTIVLNPSWFYVLQIAVLLVALFWEDEGVVEDMRSDPHE
ncbi:hypothetical protein [Agaribacter marinus]|uniref:Uncharacterized protein n=1 Tax=Agaribacter marinus TaxID=1431249 RepID=A0AA37WID3_9ALTE|nr:hypothetical protein [Agaribacter marinus]GLR70727.1 hypothetical protein GCM10007852_16350 [Agaribacter marinus]